MATEKQTDSRGFLDRLSDLLRALPWREVAAEAWQILRDTLKRRPAVGMYEILEYESTLELKDRGGKRATFRNWERMRYFQDGVIAYQDPAWGDGDILLNYRCTPGTPVDRYRSGFKTHVLISRREVKNRGAVDEFNAESIIRNGFAEKRVKLKWSQSLWLTQSASESTDWIPFV